MIIVIYASIIVFISLININFDFETHTMLKEKLHLLDGLEYEDLKWIKSSPYSTRNLDLNSDTVT